MKKVLDVFFFVFALLIAVNSCELLQDMIGEGKEEYSLELLTVGNGTISISPERGSYVDGSTVELIAVPDPGWSFNNWSGNASGSENPLSISIDGHKTITAVFTLNAVTGSSRVIGSIYWADQPVEGAHAQIKAQGNFYTLPVLAEATTGVDGSFEISSVADGSFSIYAVAPEGADDTEYLWWSGRSITIPLEDTIDVGILRLYKYLTLLSPPSGSTVFNATPTLVWQEFPGATMYHIDVFDDNTGTAVMREDLIGTTITVSSALQDGRYQWSVDAFDVNGIQIAYYSAWIFFIETS